VLRERALLALQRDRLVLAAAAASAQVRRPASGTQVQAHARCA